MIVRADPLRYVALGDSTGTGYGAHRGYVHRLHARLDEAGHAYELVNLAVNGATCADVRAGQLRRALALRPALVTVGVGGNDLRWGTAPDEFEDHLSAIVEALHASARLVLLNVPDLSLAPAARLLPRGPVIAYVVSLNERIGRIAARYRVPLADLHGACAGVGDATDLFGPDGLHPSDRGHERIAGAAWPAVERALRRDAA